MDTDICCKVGIEKERIEQKSKDILQKEEDVIEEDPRLMLSYRCR
jgi:hypothetical protein